MSSRQERVIARNSETRGSAGSVPCRTVSGDLSQASSLVSWSGHLLPASSCHLPSLRVCVLLSSPVDAGHPGSGPTLTASVEVDCLQMQSSPEVLGVGLRHMRFVGTRCSPLQAQTGVPQPAQPLVSLEAVLLGGGTPVRAVGKHRATLRKNQQGQPRASLGTETWRPFGGRRGDLGLEQRCPGVGHPRRVLSPGECLCGDAVCHCVVLSCTACR